MTIPSTLQRRDSTERELLANCGNRMATNRIITIAIITVLVLLIIAVIVSKFR